MHLGNVNTRKELHGEDHVQAVDLSFKCDFPNTILDEILAPGLREALYYNAAAQEGQMDIAEVDSTLPNLRFPKLNGQRFVFGGKDKLTGYVLCMEYGLGDNISNIELELCKIGGRVVETKEGGTVTVHFRVSNASDRLDKDTCGKLVLLGGDEVTMTLRAPAVQTEEREVSNPGNPFLNADPDPLEPNPDDIGPGPLFPETPEQALAAGVETA